MCALRNSTVSGLLEGIYTLPLGVDRVHKMHLKADRIVLDISLILGVVSELEVLIWEML